MRQVAPPPAPPRAAPSSPAALVAVAVAALRVRDAPRVDAALRRLARLGLHLRRASEIKMPGKHAG